MIQQPSFVLQVFQEDVFVADQVLVAGFHDIVPGSGVEFVFDFEGFGAQGVELVEHHAEAQFGDVDAGQVDDFFAVLVVEAFVDEVYVLEFVENLTGEADGYLELGADLDGCLWSLSALEALADAGEDDGAEEVVVPATDVGGFFAVVEGFFTTY